MSKSEDKDRLKKWEDASYTSSQVARLKVQLPAAIKEAETRIRILNSCRHVLRDLANEIKHREAMNEFEIDEAKARLDELIERQRELDD